MITTNGKANIEKTINGINISVPSKKNWFLLLFSSIWLIGWLVGFMFTFGMIFLRDINDDISSSLFIYFWLFMWTVGGLFIIFILLWGYFGKETFTTENNYVKFEKTVFGIGKKAKFEKTELRNFRTNINENSNWFYGNQMVMYGLGPGNIKFDYGLKSYSFAAAVDEAEANYIVGLLKEIFDR